MGHVGSCWVILGPCWCILGHHRAMMDQHGVIIAHLGSSLGLWGEKVSIPRATGLCKFKKHTKTCVKASIPRATGSSKSKKHTNTCVKSTFSKNGGNLGADGSVSYLFNRKGLIVVDKNNIKIDVDTFELELIDLNVDDFTEDEDIIEIISTPDNYEKLKSYAVKIINES